MSYTFDLPSHQRATRFGDAMTVAAIQPRRRRTWPQRFLLLAGLLVAGGLFAAAQIFWEARTLLAELPKIQVGAGVLAPLAGSPGEPVNLLMVGVDSSVGLAEDDPVRTGRENEDEARGIIRPDTILVVRLDPATGTVSALSLPRDLIVEAPGGTTTRINATMAVGGIESLLSTIDENFDIPINHFVIADFAGFADLVEIVGGVPIYFPYQTRDLGSGLQMDAGCWSLDGTESLSYVRSRKLEEFIDGEWLKFEAAKPDLVRIERQQLFMVLALEEVLAVGRSNIGRIGEYISAGSQAVQLNVEFTVGDMVDLATAFADYDTESLQIATVPVAAQFADDGRYLGEGLVQEDARDLLAVFQGRADGVRPADVLLNVASSNGSHIEQLVERGFRTNDADADVVGPTTLSFDPVDRNAALLVARYLEGVPQLAPALGAELRLDIGDDFSGIRVFPRRVSDIATGLDTSIRELRDESISSTTIPSPDGGSTTTSTSQTSTSKLAPEDDLDLASTSVPDNADVPKGPATSVEPSSTIVVRGRPPENVSCVPTGG